MAEQPKAKTAKAQPLAETLKAARGEREDGFRWVLSPPEERVAHVHIELQEDSEVTPEFREAINALALQVGAADPEADAVKGSCSPYKDCIVLTWKNCYILMSCKIRASSDSTI